ncbi:hypothetical protein acdb102_32470 [Acidothermaceae bacterium B102]|nr:hypothetical protein acdb102_32470 [Acidothermaceae bacterium B102]
MHLVVPVLALLAGCANASSGSAAGQPTPAVIAPATVSDPLAGCAPLPKPTAGAGVAVDYADFVQAHGVTYVALADAATVVSAGDAGPLQFKVRCALGNLNTATHQQPPPARDGDAAYLASGTPVYAQKGWPTSCRLLAQDSSQWRVFIAKNASGTPVACQPTPGTVQQTIAATTGPYGDCHSVALPPGQTAGEPDFVEFLVFQGQTYVGGQAGAKDPGHSTVAFHVRCDFGAFSDSLLGTTRSGVQSEGDAAFLPAGTVVYAITGSSPQCRLTADQSDGWHVYTANGPGCASPPPIATALPSQG